MKADKQPRAALTVIVAVTFVIATSLVLGQETSGRPGPAIEANENAGAQNTEGGCSDLTGTWKVTASEDTATWNLSKASGARYMYDASQTSPGELKGEANLRTENTLLLTYALRPDVFVALRCRLNENCQSSSSPCQLKIESMRTGRTQTYEARVTREE